jgi:signal transduction histidine kinase
MGGVPIAVYNSFVPESTPDLVPHAWAVDDLVRINRWVLVSSVVRGTVHSVNNILQTIGGQAEMLGQRSGGEEDVRRRAERIVAQTGRAASYMRELSAVGRATVESADRVDVRQSVDRAFALREYDLMRAGVAFEVVVEAERLPVCRIGPQALAVVLLNLMLNAEQALARVPDARIRVRLSHASGRITLQVRDNGPGVPHDIRAHYNSNKGSIYGVVSDRWKNLAFKAPKQSTLYPNLFFVGGSVNPGGGMPMVVLCGQNVAKKIVAWDKP